jgi:hypothetical protein
MMTRLPSDISSIPPSSISMPSGCSPSMAICEALASSCFYFYCSSFCCCIHHHLFYCRVLLAPLFSFPFGECCWGLLCL